MPITSWRDPPIIHLRDAVQRVATWREILFHVWFSQGTIDYFDEGLEAKRRIYKTRAERSVIHVQVINVPSIRPTSDAMRNRYREAYHLMHPYTKASAFVITSQGFVASLVRGVVASVILLKRPDFPTKVMSSTRAAFRFVAPLVDPAGGPPVDPDQLTSVYEQIVE